MKKKTKNESGVSEQIEVKEKKEKNNANKARSEKTVGLKFMQHVLITAAALVTLLYVAGSIVVVKEHEQSNIYHLSSSDQTRSFEDSVFFNTVFGRETEEVLRYVTIRSQLETNGVYDPDKEIDIAAYNSRINENGSSGSVTAVYHLGDLLKWGKYGIEYEPATVPAATVSGNFINHTSYYDSDGNVIYPDSSDLSAMIDRDLVINRYKTVDGLTLEECASSWEEYDELVNQLEMCAQDLYINYTEYLRYNDSFDNLNTNIRYLVMSGSGKEQIIYTNLDTKSLKPESYDKTFKKYGRFISYDFDRMLYNTDSAISESTFNTILNRYKYAYPDDCKVYIAADMSLTADDALRSARDGFGSTIIPMRREQFIAIVSLLVIAYLCLLVLCTAKEGRMYDETGNISIKLTEFDHTAVELWFLILMGIITLIAIPVSLAAEYYDSLRFEAMDYIKDIYTYIVFGVVVFVCDILVLWLYYSLVRRIKARHIWKQSFLYKILDACRRWLYSIYDNGNVLLRSVVPFVGLLLINMFLIFLMASNHDVLVFPAFLALVFVDILAGIVIYKQVSDRTKIISIMKKIISGDLSQGAAVNTYHGDNREIAQCVNSIGTSVRNAVEQSMKDERMKTDLVANVSHDIRTPLTSIINYVDLIKRENITDPKIREYVDVIDEKSQRLKTLTEDLIEVSKVSSGNVELELMPIDLTEITSQALAEFDDKINDRFLSVVLKKDDLTHPMVMADGRSLWRVIENLMTNVCKYAMTGSRVFIDIFNAALPDSSERIVLRIRNMSETPLPDDLSELTERFIRGDESRTSEGSGLGLSIAKSLTELMGGTFSIRSEADLFIAEISFEAIV